MATSRPLPQLNSVNRFFWASGEDGKLRFLHCQDCGEFTHPPRPFCRHCLSENVAPKALPGTGVVDTFTVNYQKWHPAMEVPCAIVRVAVDGAPGVILTSNVIGCDPESVDVGDQVRVVFEHQDDVYFPLFEKIG